MSICFRARQEGSDGHCKEASSGARVIIDQNPNDISKLVGIFVRCYL